MKGWFSFPFAFHLPSGVHMCHISLACVLCQGEGGWFLGTLSGSHQSPGDQKIWRSRRSRWVCKLPLCTWNVASSLCCPSRDAHSRRLTSFSIWTNWLKFVPYYSTEMCPIQRNCLRYGIWFSLHWLYLQLDSSRWAHEPTPKWLLLMHEVCMGVSVSRVWPLCPCSGSWHRRLRTWWTHPSCLAWCALRAFWRADRALRALIAFCWDSYLHDNLACFHSTPADLKYPIIMSYLLRGPVAKLVLMACSRISMKSVPARVL